MSVFSGTIFSEALDKDTHLTVVLPHDSRPHVGINGKLNPGVTAREYPKTLILLHGATDCDSTWVRRTSLERYAELYDVAIIMPDCELSSYADMVYGNKFYTYVSEELPRLAAQMFKVAVDKDSLYVAGLSMGSMGTLKLALNEPDKFAAAGAFSGAGTSRNDNSPLPKNNIGLGDYIQKAVFGDPPVIPDKDDIYWVADHMSNQEPVKLYMCVGDNDFLYERVTKFRDYIEDNEHIELVYEEWNGSHAWDFWDVAIQKFFELYFT